MKKKIIVLSIVLLLLGIICVFAIVRIKNNNENINGYNQLIENLKNDIGVTGNSEIYDVAEENGEQVLYVKDDVKFKVALAGLLKNQQPKKDEVDNIISQHKFVKNGIFVAEKSRNDFLKFIENYTSSTYKFDENGFLCVDIDNKLNDNDRKLQNAITSNKLYLIDFSDKCYIVDDATGDIVDYPFEIMDPYQAYQIYSSGSQMVVFITTNSKNKLSDDDIFDEIILLFEQ